MEVREMTMSHDIVIWPSDMSDEPSDTTIHLAGTLFLTSTSRQYVKYTWFIYMYMLTMVSRGFADRLTVSRAKPRFYVHFLVDGA